MQKKKKKKKKREDSRPAIWRLTQSHQTNGLIELTKGKVQTSSIQALLMLPSLSLQQQTLARRRFPIYYKYIL
jgi:hypothetical protein